MDMDTSTKNLAVKEENAQDGLNSYVRNRPIWNGNFNVWWLLGATLSIWFTMFRGFPMLFVINKITRMTFPTKVWFAFHLVSVTLVSWLCIWNLFHTPSHGPTYRRVHKILGRIAMVTGFVGAGTGFVIVWIVHYQGVTPFAIGITIGGVMQLTSQCIGLWYIWRGPEKKHNILGHMFFMSGVFFGGCIVPAIMRLPVAIGVKVPYWEAYSWSLPLLMGYLFYRALKRGTWY